MILDPLPFLSASQSVEGGWGYKPGAAPVVEATCAALIVLQHQSQAEALYVRALAWLLDSQHDDGGWGLNHLDPQSAWMTAWAVWALAGDGRAQAEAKAGAQWLLDVPVMQVSNLDDLAMGKKVAGIDFSLRGWPWQPGEASWLEPTSLAVLALTKLGSLATSRLAEAARYLVNRRCPGGGWNVGNPVMFGSYLPARAQPSALGLMALHQLSRESVLESDIDVLQKEALREDLPLALGWACLALAFTGSGSEQLILRLIQKQDQNGSWDDNPFTTAIAWQAIREAVI